jgi:hypothetical protein
MPTVDSIAGLPGEALVRQGLMDLQSGHCTAPACLVEIARSRLTRSGLIPADTTSSLPEPELRLYRLLGQEGGDAYSRYNALLRELISFEQALDARQSASQTRTGGAGIDTPHS